MEKVFVRSPYNYDTGLASLSNGLVCDDLTRTQQQFAEECDINTIVRRFGLTGELPQNLKVPLQGDFTEVTDYQSALHLMMAAEDSFMQMPADVRKRFDNDPGMFLDFISEPQNRDEAIKLGLVIPTQPESAKAPPEPVKAAPAQSST